MTKRISISRAARLVGIKRGVLQQYIRDGKLRTFEGELELVDLLNLYPETSVEDNSMLERVELIIESAAFSHGRTSDYHFNREVLSNRVMALSRELAFHQKRNKTYKAFADRISRELDRQNLSKDIHPFLQWLRHELEGINEDEITIDDAQASSVYIRTMTAQVKVLPSGHEFFVDGADSILEAGLRGGLALNYGCSNGNCGQCKIRVASGETKQIRHHDYVISESEKGVGYVLSCSHTPVTDITIEAEEADGTQDIPHQSMNVRFKKADLSDKHTAIVNLKTSRTNRLRFLAGQSVTLSIEGVGTSVYPIASCPCDDMNLQFHLPINNDDPVADYFCSAAKTNDLVGLEGPNGSFSLNENSPNSLVFISQDEGFAPIKGLIEHAMALDTAETIYLVRFASQDKQHYLRNLCRAWNDALDNFHYVEINYSDSVGEELKRFFNEQLFREDDSRSLDFYVCGHQEIVELVQAQLSRRDIPENQLAWQILATPKWERHY